MDTILQSLSNRRVWAGIVAGIAIILQILKVNYNLDIPAVTDLLTNFGGAVSLLITAGLALWSYFKPKTSTTNS